MRGLHNGAQYLRDLATLKSFVTGPSMVHLFDAPWALIYLMVIFLIHPMNGWITCIGAIVLFSLALIHDWLTKSLLKKANESQLLVMSEADALTNNRDVIRAMGMSNVLIQHWQTINAQLLRYSMLSSGRSLTLSAVTKGIRMILQMLIMAMSAVLVIQQQMSPGGIIATSILSTKALAPFDAAMSIWKTLIDCQKSYSRLNDVLALNGFGNVSHLIQLPEPDGNVSIERCVFALPGTDTYIIKGVNITIESGQCIGIIGESGSGKTTLARLLAELFSPPMG